MGAARDGGGNHFRNAMVCRFICEIPEDCTP